MGETGSFLTAASGDLGGFDLSVVVPVYDEVENLSEFYRRLDLALSGLRRRGQIVFVDDGSRDGSFSIMEDLFQRDDRVMVVRLRHHCGKAHAYQAGFHHAQGDIVVTMDSDLQDDPREITRLLDKIEEGYDFVTGWKQSVKTPGPMGVLSKLFNWMVARISRLPLHDFNCPFRAFRRAVLKDIRLYGELHRFIPLLVAQQGYRMAEVPVSNSPRWSGRSKYGWVKILRGSLDFFTVLFITRYVNSPLYLFGTIGAGLLTLGLAIDGYLTVTGLIRGEIGHTAMLLLGILLMLAGLQLFSLGLLAELLVRQRSAASDEVAIARVLEQTPKKDPGPAQAAVP